MKIGFIAAIACLLLSPCVHARDRGNGSAAGGASRNAAPTLEHCDGALGTLTVVEDQAGDWHHYLTGDLRLGSTIPSSTCWCNSRTASCWSSAGARWATCCRNAR